MNRDYEVTLKMLSTMDGKQLAEFWHDLRPLCSWQHIENIGESAIGYVEMHCDDDDEPQGKSEHEEWREMDYAARVRGAK